MVSATATLALAVAACGSGSGGSSAESGNNAGSSGGSKLTISYSQNVGDEIPLWIASDAGYFKKNGLDVTVTNITGNKGIPALLSGQVDIASIGGSDALSAAAAHADLKYILTLIPTYTFQFWAQPKYATASALKGQRVGVTSASGSLYVGTVLSLKQLGLTPSDVQIVPLGSVANVNSALLAGSVVAAASHPPDTYKFKQHGLKQLVDLPAKHIPAAISGFTVQSSYAQQNPDVLQQVAKSIIQAIQRAKQDKAYAEKEMAKYMGVKSKGEADFTYDFYINKLMKTVPLPKVDQFQATKTSLQKKNPNVADVNLSSFIDQQFVQKAASALGVHQ